MKFELDSLHFDTCSVWLYKYKQPYSFSLYSFQVQLNCKVAEEVTTSVHTELKESFLIRV